MGVLCTRRRIERRCLVGLGMLSVAVASVFFAATDYVPDESSVESGSRIGSVAVSLATSANTSKANASPSSLPFNDERACAVIDMDVAASVDVVDPQRSQLHNDVGSVGGYSTSEADLFVLLTDGPSKGLSELLTQCALVRSQTVEPFAARQEAGGQVRTVDVDVKAGRAPRIIRGAPSG